LNAGIDYHRPVFVTKEFHANVNVAYSSKYNSDTSLSSYGWIPAKTTADLSIGIATKNQSFDISLLVKNLFNDKTPSLQTWNSITPAVPRWIGVTLSGKL